MRLDAAMLFVKDLGRMAEFYGDILGLKPIDETRSDTWVEFDAGGSHFALHAIPDEMAAAVEISVPPRPREKNPVKLIFEVADVERERARLEAIGVTMLIRPWGGCDAVDPEGNIFQLCPPRNG